MHLYWRIREELLYLGESLVFLDPRFTREYGRWEARRFLGTANPVLSESPRRLRLGPAFMNFHN